ATPSSLADLIAGYPLFNSSTLLTVLYLPPLSANPSTGLHSVSPPFSANPPLTSTQCPPPFSANPSTGLHSVSSTPLCQSLHWPPLSVCLPSLPIPPLTPLSVLHPSLPIPPLASTQCPPPLSATPSTGLHSVSSTPLYQSLHWPPFSVLHPSLPIPPLTSTQCPPPLSANPSTDLHSVSSTPLCQSLH
ncbi:unnamed protein product, partial [Staurois parvus]